MTDPELDAMHVMLEELDTLDPAAIKRILIWLADRYDIDLVARRTTTRKSRTKRTRRQTREHASEGTFGMPKKGRTSPEIEALLRLA
ncbi:hypothetical protein RXV95_14820 [Novosphingobium sp. ZN18A2]|uniref:hypothetical protein n=1 Tax=Novosphingobium sp. ZN18A2 TaxID=3079861 RepID=UPI0030CE7BC1